MFLNLSGISQRSVAGRLLRAPLSLLPQDLCVWVLQGPLRGGRWLIGSSTHGCWLGSYEFEKQRLFAGLAKPGSVVWDVGAHVGFYTLLAARAVGPSGRVVAFEPLPRNLRYLRRHIALNHLTNADVLAVAVGDVAGRGSFQCGQSSSMGRLTGDRQDLLVNVAVLDELVAEGRIPLPQLIKMDIEGGEVAALRGAQSLLSQAKPDVLVATHGTRVHQECVQHLRALGYRVEGIGGQPVDQTDELIARAG